MTPVFLFLAVVAAFAGCGWIIYTQYQKNEALAAENASLDNKLVQARESLDFAWSLAAQMAAACPERFPGLAELCKVRSKEAELIVKHDDWADPQRLAKSEQRIKETADGVAASVARKKEELFLLALRLNALNHPALSSTINAMLTLLQKEGSIAPDHLETLVTAHETLLASRAE